MLARPLRVVSIFLVCSALVAQAQITTAITGARVIDGTGTPAHIETVIIRDNRIVAVSDRAEIPAGARIIDATGLTLMPGLFDLHTHLNASGTDAVDDFGKSLKAYLVCGVTSVNDYSVYGEMLAPLRSLQNSGVLVGPKVNFAIRFGTPEGHGAEFGWRDYFTQLVSTPAEAHTAMKKILPYKPDVIKAFTDGWRYGRSDDLTNMNVETLSAIVEDAHRAGIKVFTHTVTLNGAKIAARAGVDVLAHGVGDAPLTRGGVELADVSAFNGVKFAVRGQGSYRTLIDSYGARRSSWYTASFTGDAKWRTIRAPFAAFQSKGSTSPPPLRELRALHFELARPAGADAWLELDDLKLY